MTANVCSKKASQIKKLDGQVKILKNKSFDNTHEIHSQWGFGPIRFPMFFC